MSTSTRDDRDKAPADWRSASGPPRERVEHRWQESRENGGGPRRTFQWVVLTGLLLAVVGALVAFVWWVAFRPIRTPYLAVVAPAYGDPFPPNAWSREDLDRMSTLHGETIDLVDLSNGWTTRESGLRALDRELLDIAETARRCGSAVVHLGMHGAVDGTGRPCLLPPGGSPIDDRTWIPVADVITRLEAFGGEHGARVLLVLDPGRLDVDWNLGVTENRFAERLVALVEGAPPEHVVVLNAAGPREIVHASPTLQGTPFGVHLHRGLGGEADKGGYGNGDGCVSVHELHGYLLDTVNAWARRHDGTTQRPLLLPEKAPDHVVAWALNEARRPRIEAQLAETPPLEPAVSQQELDRAWAAYERVPSNLCERINPVAWGTVRRLLRRVEVGSVAGRDYAEPTRRDHTQLVLLLEAAAETVADAEKDATTLSVVEEWTLLGPPGRPLPDFLPAHTLPLAEHLGAIDRADANKARTDLGELDAGRRNPDEVEAEFASRFPGRVFAELAFRRWARFATEDAPPPLDDVLRVRRRGESLAALGDERTLAWVVDVQSAADESRREAEDRTLAGVSEAGEWDGVSSRYDRVESRSKATRTALEAIDRAAARLPLHTAWATDPRRIATLSAEGGNVLVEDLRNVANDIGELRSAVRSRVDVAVGDPAPFVDLAQQLATALEAREQTLTAEYTRLEQDLVALAGVEAPTVEELRRMTTLRADGSRLLDVPLLPAATSDHTGAERRGRLRRNLESLRTRIAEAAPAIDLESLGDLEPAFPENSTPTVADGLAHPVEIVLGIEGPANETESDVTPWAVGARVRDRLQSARTRAESHVDAAATTVTERREQLAASVDVVRETAALHTPPLDVDPINRLRLFDLHRLLVWQAGRAVDDFWGPFGGTDAGFFAAAANGYLEHVGEFAPDSPMLRDEARRLRERLERRTRAAQNGLAVVADDVVVLDPTAGADVEVVVSATATAEADGLPLGTATIAVRNDKGPIARTKMPVPIPRINTPTDLRAVLQKHLELGDLVDGRPQLVAEVRFRGHRFADEFLFEPVDGPSTRFVPQRLTASRVRLATNEKKPLSVVFVLDCSNSMREAAVVEQPGVRPPTKLDIARRALGNLLDELGTLDGVEVGVILFGHRVGWEPGEIGQLHRQERYARIARAPAELRPYADVEAILPPGRFDLATARATSELLTTVLPWGESPLYLAVRRAAELLGGNEEDGERVVIVLTDGLNNQFAPPASDKVDLDDVLQDLRGTGIRVHVVGFGIPEEERRKAKTEFEQLGSYDVRPARATALLESIRESLGPRNYSIGTESLPLGTPGRVPIPAAPPVTATVTYDEINTQLDLYGGEAVDLELDAIGRRIVTRPVREPGVRVPLEPAEESAEGPPRSIVVHPPVRRDDSTTFAFTLVRDDRVFPDRPLAVRFEVVPIDDRGRPSESRYVFVDPNYVAGHTHQRLEYDARSWPANAVRAEVRGWVRFAKSDPDETIELKTGIPGEQIVRRLAREPGVSLRVSTTRLEEGQIDVYALADGPARRPGRLTFEVRPATAITEIVRQYDAKHGIDSHTFRVQPGSTTGLRLEVFSETTWKRQADRFPEPVTIDVVDPSDLVVPTLRTPG